MYDLKGFRQAFNLTQKQLAEILKCQQSNISGMEKTMRDLEPIQKKRLEEAYGSESVAKFVVSSFLESTINDSRNKGDMGGYTTYLLPMSAMGGTLTGFAAPGAMLQNCEATDTSPLMRTQPVLILIMPDSFMVAGYPSKVWVPLSGMSLGGKTHASKRMPHNHGLLYSIAAMEHLSNYIRAVPKVSYPIIWTILPYGISTQLIQTVCLKVLSHGGTETGLVSYLLQS